ncbi:MAG TPA: ribosome silencing factor [Polyangia bacterium]|nr:ribosome silencing factor [Polyangia bacterium]
MKKTRSATGAKGKDGKDKKRAARADRPSGRKAAPERIPVRGARKSKVKPRPAEAARPARSEDDVAATRALAVAAMEAALDKRALDPVLIDVSAMGSYTDFIGVVSGRSDRQVDAIAEAIGQAMKARGLFPLGREGEGTGRWTLLDFGGFVVHVFYHPVREFYDLESLWIEAPRVKLEVPPEAALGQPDALYGAL